MSVLVNLLAEHFMYYNDDAAIYECLDPEGDSHASFGDPQGWRVHLVEAVAAAGLVVVPAFLVNGTVKSFRDIEGLQLYDAATHRWIDALAAATTEVVS